MRTLSRRFTAGLLLGAAFGMGAAASGATAAGANGAMPCPAGPPGAILVEGNVCQLVVGSSSDVRLPSGLTKLSIVAFGGGGGGYFSPDSHPSFGGGAGAAAVIEFDEIALLGPSTSETSLSVLIGAGGAAQDGRERDTTAAPGLGTSVDITSGGIVLGSLVADGGQGGYYGAETISSGSAFDGSFGGGAGGSAASAAPGSATGGLGYASFADVVSSFELDAELWNDVSALGSFTNLGFGGDGGTTPSTFTSGRGSGGHGIVSVGDALEPKPGSPGLVVIRYAVEPKVEPTPPVGPGAAQPSAHAAELAHTGSAEMGGLAALGAVAALAGAVIVASGQRRQRSSAR